MIVSVLSALSITLGNYSLTFAINVLKNGNLSQFITKMVFFILLLLGGYVSNILMGYLFNSQVQIYSHQLRENFVQSAYNNSDTSVDFVQNKLTNDLKTLTNQYATPLFSIFTGALTLAFSCVALFTLNWTLMILVVVLAIGILFLPRLLSKSLQVTTMNVSKSNREYLSTIDEWFSGLSEIRRYGAKGHFYKVLSRESEQLEQNIMKRVGKVCTLGILNTFANVFSQFLVIAWTGYLISKNSVSFGTILSAGQFAEIIFNGVVTISNSFGSILSSKTLSKEFMEHARQVKNIREGPDNNPNQVRCLVTHKLTKSFPNGETLVFPDLCIRMGEKILITGDSGSGKSTLLKILIGEVEPTKGNVEFLNGESKTVKVNLNKIGYIPQDAILFPDTIKNNITMFNAKLDSLINEVVKGADLKKDIDSFDSGLGTVLNLKEKNFSGGQRQKIIIARAVIHEQKILIIDEGTSAIDYEGTSAILKSLLSLPITVLFVAHNFDASTRSLFDREICIKK
ncbi:ATP-binding cassette domain-containing protein [Levilactobacillus yiduensis]|uniref:ATP-binding cassette domain-containing protein n=1 Tax=Levilactobacillus yiduensis TaxID=2953880 RepID=UPI001AD83B6B|nr:ABC transporter ATP-binding protein [Levilactobacillus yiduensis]